MKKALILCLLSVLLVGLPTGESEAAPPGQAGQAVITSPRDNDVVRGLLVIKGTATHPNFWKYEIHYALEPTNQWVVLGVHETQVVDGRLEVWDTTQVPDGSYSLRLRVVRKDGNYDEYYVRQISVANAQPTETPTPAESPTPTTTPTPLPPTPTVVIEQPPTATPRPAPPTPAPTRRPTPTSTINIPFQALGRAFVYGAGAAIGLFVLIGLLTLLRWLISWLLSGH